MDAIRRVSEKEANILLQELEKDIRASEKSSVLEEYIKSTDENFSRLHRHITDRTTFFSSVQVNIFSAVLYSILLILFLVIGNYTYPGIGKFIGDFFSADQIEQKQGIEDSEQ